MNLDEVVTNVIGLTGRQNKVAAALAVNGALSRLALRHNFKRDLVEVTYPISSQAYTGTIDLTNTTYFTRFKAIKTIRPTTIKKALNYKDIDQMFVDNNVALDSFYIAGTTISFTLRTLSPTLEIAYYQYSPTVDNTNKTHWLLDIIPYAIIDIASSLIFQSIGDDQSATAYMNSGMTAFTEATAHLIDQVVPVAK